MSSRVFFAVICGVLICALSSTPPTAEKEEKQTCSTADNEVCSEKGASLLQASEIIHQHRPLKESEQEEEVDDGDKDALTPPDIKVSPPQPAASSAEEPKSATKHHHIVDPEGDESLHNDDDEDDGGNAQLLQRPMIEVAPHIKITPPTNDGKFQLIQRANASGHYWWSGYEKIRVTVDTDGGPVGASIWIGIAGDFPSSLSSGQSIGLRLWYRLYAIAEGSSHKLLHNYVGCTLTVPYSIDCQGIPWQYLFAPNPYIKSLAGMANFGLRIETDKDVYVKACSSLNAYDVKSQYWPLIPFCAGLPDYTYLANFR